MTAECAYSRQHTPKTHFGFYPLKDLIYYGFCAIIKNGKIIQLFGGVQWKK